MASVKLPQSKARSRKDGAAIPLDEADKRLMNLLQSSFPLDPEPFALVASAAELELDDVLTRTQRLLDERIIREIRRRTRAVGVFPDGYSALMLVAARLRHIASTKWAGYRQPKCERLLKTLSSNLIIHGWMDDSVPASSTFG